MPLYEYECTDCKHRFERIQKFSDPKVDICPECGGKVRKLLSSPAIQFKGSGFYITDYARKSGTPAGSSEKSSSSDGGDKKSDSSSSSSSDKSSSDKSSSSSETSKSDTSKSGSKAD